MVTPTTRKRKRFILGKTTEKKTRNNGRRMFKTTKDNVKGKREKDNIWIKDNNNN